MLKWNKTLILILIVSLLFWGCGDRSNIELLQSIRPDISELIKTEVVTDLPDEVWETMKYARQMFREEQQEELKQLQEAYYNRYIDAGGVAIVGNEVTPDEYFVITKNIFLLMTSKYPVLRERLSSRYYNIITKSSLLTVPEMFDQGQLFWVGTLGETVATDEDGIPIGRYGWTVSSVKHSVGLSFVFSVFTHEVAHLLEDEIGRHIDPDFLYFSPHGAGWQGKLYKAYKNAEEKRLWRDDVLRGSAGEYWAELTVIWFFRIGNNSIYDYFQTVEEFVEHDPLGAALIMEYFPNISFFGLRDYLNDREYLKD